VVRWLLASFLALLQSRLRNDARRSKPLLSVNKEENGKGGTIVKFLVIRKPRITSAMVATSKLLREHKERVLDAVKQGGIDCIYAIPGGGGSIGIANADSIDQLNDILTSSPLFLFSEFEVRPLTDYAKYMDGVAAALEKQGR
jgi:muconolactone delta-isomerase